MSEFRTLIREEIKKALNEAEDKWFNDDAKAVKLQSEIDTKLERIAKRNGTDELYSGSDGEETASGAIQFAATLPELRELFPTVADRKKLEVLDFNGDPADDTMGYTFAVVPSRNWDVESIGFPFKKRLSSPKYSREIDSYKKKLTKKTGYSNH